jgi:hypothetical protein
MIAWDDEIDEILGGDLTAALGYRTPAGGVVVQAVAPIGMRDRAAGTIGFTTVSTLAGSKMASTHRTPKRATGHHRTRRCSCC